MSIRDVLEVHRELARLNRRKSEFFATLAHELRAPLGAGSVALDVLRERLRGDEVDRAAVVHATEVMGRQIAHMVRLVEDLTDLASVGAGKLELRRERVEVQAVVAGAVELSEPIVKRKRHELTLVIPEAAVWLEADRVRVTQVVANLLANAARYTPEGGHIRLQTAVEDDAVVLSVADDGDGMTACELADVFAMFHQRRGAREGMGVGLALARRIAELHGGTLTAQSDGPGRGSVFRIRLPRLGRRTRSPITLGRVVLVDTDADLGATTAELLRAEGFLVRTAVSPSEGFDLILSGLPDAALVDWSVGSELATRVRREPAITMIRLVACMDADSGCPPEAVRAAGFDALVLKPAPLAKIRAAVAGASEGSSHAG